MNMISSKYSKSYLIWLKLRNEECEIECDEKVRNFE